MFDIFKLLTWCLVKNIHFHIVIAKSDVDDIDVKAENDTTRRYLAEFY